MDDFRFADMLTREGEPLEPYIAAAYLLCVDLAHKGSPFEGGSQSARLTEAYDRRGELGIDERVLSFVERALLGRDLDGGYLAVLSCRGAGNLSAIANDLCQRERQAIEGDWVPESLARLLACLAASGKARGKFASLGCGTGRLAGELGGRFDSVALWDENEDFAVMAAVILELVDGVGTVKLLGDPMHAKPGEFDCITAVLSPSGGHARKRARNVTDWQRCEEVVNLLSSDGKAAVLLSLSSLNNRAGRRERMEFLASFRGVEAVVALPQACMTSLRSPALVLINKGIGRDSIRMVDATGFGRKGRGGLPFSFSNREMDEIAALIEGDASDSKRVKNVETASLYESDWRLDPQYHLDNVVAVAGGRCLTDIVDVWRGVSNLDKKLRSEEEGGVSVPYLEIGAIEDGEIDPDRLGSVSLDPWAAGDCDKNSANCGDIVVSKAGPNFKVALVDQLAGSQSILASSNFFVLHAREGDDLDSMYLRAFFDSEKSWGQIRRSAAGSGRIKALSINALRKMRVPWPDPEERRRIAEAYEEKRGRLRKLKAEMEACRNEMGELFDEVKCAESGEADA